MLSRFLTFIAQTQSTDRGASMVEYSLLVLLVAIVALVAVDLAGTELSGTYSEIHSGLEWANSQS